MCNLVEAAKVILIAVWLVFVGGQSHVISAEMTECLQQARMLPLAIQSIDYTYSNTATEGTKRMAIQGNSWYFGFTKLGAEAPFREFAHDGKKWEQNEEGKFFSFSERSLLPIAQAELHPILLPYYWFSEDTKVLALNDLYDQDEWAKVISRMVFDRNDETNGKECEVYHLDYDKKKFSIWFSKNDFGFPVLVQSENSRGKSELRVNEFVTFPGPVVIGVAVSMGNDKSAVQYSIDKSTLRVNQPIDPGVFSLNPTGAPEVIDIDERRRIRDSSVASKSTFGSNLMYVVVVMVVAVFGLLAWRRHAQH